MYGMHERSLRSFQNTCKTSKFPGSMSPRSPNHNPYYGPHFCLCLGLSPIISAALLQVSTFWVTNNSSQQSKIFLESAHSIFIASDNYYLFLKFHNTENLESTMYQWELYQELIGHALHRCPHNIHKISVNLQCMNSKTKHETSKWKFGQ